jgi:hypothetical protein
MADEANAPATSLEDAISQGFDEAANPAAGQKSEDGSLEKVQSQAEVSSDKSDQGDEGGEAEAEQGDSTAKKEQNRVGYQLRQLRGTDEFIRKSRDNLNDWVNEAENQEDARLRRIEANQFLADVEKSRAQLQFNGEQAAREIDIFNPESDSFNQQVLNRAFQRYARDQLITDTDASGQVQVIGYKTPLLDYLREEADAYMAGVESAKSQGKPQHSPKPKTRTDSGAEVVGAVSPKTTEPPKSAFDDAFDSGFDSIK